MKGPPAPQRPYLGHPSWPHGGLDENGLQFHRFGYLKVALLERNRSVALSEEVCHRERSLRVPKLMSSPEYVSLPTDEDTALSDCSRTWLPATMLIMDYISKTVSKPPSKWFPL